MHSAVHQYICSVSGIKASQASAEFGPANLTFHFPEGRCWPTLIAEGQTVCSSIVYFYNILYQSNKY